MSDLTFGALLELMLLELAETVQRSEASADAAHVRIDKVELDIPAHIQLQTSLETERALDARRLIVALPSLRDTAGAGRVGRIKVTIEADRQIDTSATEESV